MIIQLWQSFHRFDGRSLFFTWMYRVAINTAISYHRTKRRQTRDAVPLEEVELEVVAADPPLEAPGDDVRLLHQMIAGLDALNRSLFILYLDGHSHAVMAEILGLTPSNVATRLSRIKQKLQREYETKHNLQQGA